MPHTLTQMSPTEEAAPTRQPAFVSNILIFVALAFVVTIVASLIDGRPFGQDRLPDLFVMTLLAGVAGACAALGRFMFLLASLPSQTVPSEDLTPEVRSMRRQYRVVFWLGVLMFFFFAAILFLLAVSIGTGHREWVSWMPALPRRRGLIDLLFR
jgi:hypothetical protein